MFKAIPIRCKLVASSMAVCLTLLMFPMSALATGVSSPASGTGSGTASDPYVITTDSSTSTMPSSFWGYGSGNNPVTGTDVGTFAVTFDQTANVGFTSKMTFDMTNGINAGNVQYGLGPIYAGDGTYNPLQTGTGNQTGGSAPASGTALPYGSQYAAQVWNGAWTYAFRLCPAVTYGTDGNGDDALAFDWKGCFATYFTDWNYTFNANSFSEGGAANKTVTLTYYGGYAANQTSRGTNYTPELTSGTTNLYYSTQLYTHDTPVGYSVSATADSNGNVTFSGANSIKYGGNYHIEVN